MKIISYCFSCHKEYDVTHIDPMAKGLKCECGGYYITPNGKVQSRCIPETEEDYKLLSKIVKDPNCKGCIYDDGEENPECCECRDLKYYTPKKGVNI
jgi:hypothetical protein